MNSGELFLTDYVANESSMQKLRGEFAQYAEGLDFNRFKAIICQNFPEIDVRNNQLLSERRKVSHAQKGIGINHPLAKKGFPALGGRPFLPPSAVQKPSFVMELGSSTSVVTLEEESGMEVSPSLEGSLKGTSSIGPEDSAATSPSGDVPRSTPENDLAVGTKPWLRRSRHHSKQELAGLVVVEPLKEIFNHIDRQNLLVITWDEMVQYLVEESGHRTSAMEDACRTYTFSRKMIGNKVEVSWLINNAADPAAIKKLLNRKTSADSKKEKQTMKSAWETFAPPIVVPELFLIHFIHGLPGHMMFAMSTRSTPLALYKKSDLSHYRTLTPEELDNTVPTLVDYLPQPDTIISYSSGDASIRGWTFLLSKNNTTSLTPLRIDGQVQRMRTCTEFFPYSVFAGTTLGHIVRVDVPSLRSGTEMRVVQVFENVHDLGCGGVVDFVVTETHIFSTGFDHCVLSINMQTGHVVVIGNCSASVYLLEYSAMFSLVLGVSYKNELLSWDAKGIAAVPGTPFNHALEKEHLHRIKRLICVKDLPHCLTIDIFGGVKMWDLRMQQCVQTTSVNGTTSDVVDPEAIYGMKSKADDTSNPNSMQTIVDATYFEEFHEMVSCTSDTVYLLQYNLREDVSLCDFDAVNQIFYDVREKTFVLQGSTRISTWDAQGGYRKRVVDRALSSSIPPLKRDIAALCIDDVGSRVFISLNSSEIEVQDTKNMAAALERIHTPAVLTEMLFSNFYKLLVGVSADGTLFLRNEEERMPSTTAMRISLEGLYSLTLSEELGLMACCDEKGFLFLHDIKKVENPSQLCRVDRRILSCRLLGASPILATSHDGGDICLWSCPPIAEVFLQLAVFNVCTKLRSPEGINFYRAARTGVAQPAQPSQTVQFQPSQGTNPSDGSSTSLQTKPQEASWARKSFHLPHSFDELIQTDIKRKEYIRERNRKLEKSKIPEAFEVTKLAFDDDSHRLFCADNRGSISIFCMCSFFQWFQIKPVTFETRSLYFLDHWGIGAPECIPRYIQTVQPHSRDGILTIRWISNANVLLTSGVDRKVCVFDSEGNECGVLSKARLPQRDTLDESKSSLHSSVNQFRFTDLPPYRLPLAPRKSRRETLFNDIELYCRHPLEIRSEKRSSTPEVDPGDPEISDAEKHGSISSGKQSLKHLSTRLVDFVPDTVNNSHVSLGNELTLKKEVFLKKTLAAMRAERNSKLSQEKVETFPSSAGRETLSRFEETRAHCSQADNPPSALFACEFEPTTGMNAVLPHSARRQQSKAEREQASSPVNLPKLPPAARPMKAKMPSPQSTPELDFTIVGGTAGSPWQSKTYTSIPFNDTDDPQRVGSQIGAKSEMLAKEVQTGMHPTLYGGSPSDKFANTLPNGIPKSRSRSGNHPSRFQTCSSPVVKKSDSSQKSQLDSVITEYKTELRRCIAGESADQRDRLRISPKSAYSNIGKNLKAVDRKFT